MKLDPKTVKSYSRLGQRAAFGLSALELAQMRDDLLVMTADVSTSAGLDRYRKTFPERFIDAGIAEQNMVTMAAALAGEGFRVVTATFAPFQTMRCCEQIRVNLGYMKHRVCLVGLAGGLALGVLGATHCAIEDIGVLRSIPNLAIVSPADCGQVAKALFAAVDYPTSVYLRLTGAAPAPIIYGDDFDFTIGRGIVLRSGAKVALIGNGTLLGQTLKAADLLQEAGLSPSVVDMHTVKPLDTELLDQLAENHDLFVTVEEHSIIGGLGSAVAEHLAGRGGPRLRRLGVRDEYESVGSYDELLARQGLAAEAIARDILAALNAEGL